MCNIPAPHFRAALSARRLFDGEGALQAQSCEARARLLEAAGVRSRQGVAICLENGRACIEAYIAVSLLDAVAVPLPPTLPQEERLRLWLQLGCSTLIDATGVRAISLYSEQAPLWPADIHWVMHSSGSTGVPKAIPLTFSAALNNAEDVMRALGITGEVTHLGSMSQCYTNGLYNSFLLPILTGGRAYVGPIASVMGLGAYRNALRKAKAKVLWVNPAVVAILTKRGDADDVQDANVLISCTAPLDQGVCETAERVLRRPVLQSYGLTETLIVSIEASGRSVAEEFSAGLPISGPGSVHRNADGVLEITNRAVTPGYVTLTAGGLRFELPSGHSGQSFLAGDLVEFDSGGRLHIRGRSSAVINVAGVKVSAEQLEEALREWPGVINAAVVAMSLSEGLTRPAALLETSQEMDFAAIGDHCAGLLGPAARLAAIRCVDRIPLTANGKVDRRAASALLTRTAR